MAFGAPNKGSILIDIRKPDELVFNTFQENFPVRTYSHQDLQNVFDPTLGTLFEKSQNNLDDSSTVLNELDEGLFRDHLKEKMIISCKHNFILRKRHFNMVEVVDWTGGIQNSITFPGILLDMDNSEQGLIFLGYCKDGNYVCTLRENQLVDISEIGENDIRFIDDSRFLHRVHWLEGNRFLAHSIFHYSFQEV